MAYRGKELGSKTFKELWTIEDNSQAGILLLREDIHVSISGGKRKKRLFHLFENCLVISREKTEGQLVVLKVLRESLLQVHFSTTERSPGHGGILDVYWISGPNQNEEIASVQLQFPENADSTLKVWAAFLALAVPRDKINSGAEAGDQIPSLELEFMDSIHLTIDTRYQRKVFMHNEKVVRDIIRCYQNLLDLC